MPIFRRNMLFPFFSPDNSNYASPKRCCLLHVVETQIIIIIILTAVKTSHLTMSKKFQIVTRTVYNVRQGMDQSFENSLLLHRSMNQKTPSATMSVTDVFPRNNVCERTVLKQCPCCTHESVNCSYALGRQSRAAMGDRCWAGQ
jgi:hypothetical protein